MSEKKRKLDYLGVSAFCESMAMMVQAGISTDEAIGLLQSEKKGDGVLETALAVMKEQVDAGAGLAAAMKESGIFPDYALQIVEAGERAGWKAWELHGCDPVEAWERKEAAKERHMAKKRGA